MSGNGKKNSACLHYALELTRLLNDYIFQEERKNTPNITYLLPTCSFVLIPPKANNISEVEIGLQHKKHQISSNAF